MADEGETLQTIYQKLWFLILPAKVLGLLPWRIVNGDRLTREGLFGRICGIFLVVGSSLPLIRTMRIMIPRSGILEMDNIINPFTVEILSVVGCFLIVFGEIYRELTDAETGRQIIESFGKYDRKVKQLGLARKDNFLFIWIITLSTIVPILVSLITLIGMPNRTIFDFFLDLVTFPIRIAYDLAHVKYVIIVHLLYQRYKHLNEIVLPKDKWRTRGNLEVNRRFVNMCDLVYLHSTLTRATEIVIKVYSFELLIWIISPIWELLVASCYVKMRHDIGMTGYVNGAQLILAIWSLCWICETTANEANKFAMQILRTDPELIRSRDIDEQLDAAIYMNNHKISFRVLNLYQVNVRTLVFIATMTLNFGGVLFDGYHGALQF